MGETFNTLYDEVLRDVRYAAEDFSKQREASNTDFDKELRAFDTALDEFYKLQVRFSSLSLPHNYGYEKNFSDICFALSEADICLLIVDPKVQEVFFSSGSPATSSTDILGISCCQKTSRTYYQIPLKEISEQLSRIKYLIALLKRLSAEIIRLQYLSYLAQSRISRSPTPQKKEPPVGGVKIGGEQHGLFRHVAEILYLEQTFRLKQAA